jgi:hypothetical protein
MLYALWRLPFYARALGVACAGRRFRPSRIISDVSVIHLAALYCLVLTDKSASAKKADAFSSVRFQSSWARYSVLHFNRPMALDFNVI